MTTVYRITVELADLDMRARDAGSLGHRKGRADELPDTRVADLVRELFYDHTNRYFDEIHAVVVGPMREEHPA